MQRAAKRQCVSFLRTFAVAAPARATPSPLPRPKVRKMPLPGEKPVIPPAAKSEQNSTPFQHAASAQTAAQGEPEMRYVREEDVMERIYTHEPPRNPAFYYVGVIFLFFVGLNVADAYRLDSLGTVTRPLLRSEDKMGQPVAAERKREYTQGALAIIAGTTVLCGVLAYLPTRHVSTITVIPRFPKPQSDQHRIAWYHHSDAIIHSTADFIALPLAPFRKGRRVPFASLRLESPLTSRPSPLSEVGGTSAIKSRASRPRSGSIAVVSDQFPWSRYFVARPDALNVKVDCDDILVLESALHFNKQVEAQWKASEEQRQKAGR